MLTAEQKIRQMVPSHIQHEGDNIIRWLTGGNEPGVYVTLRHNGLYSSAHCPLCKIEYGKFDASYGSNVYQQIETIRILAHQHRKTVHQ